MVNKVYAEVQAKYQQLEDERLLTRAEITEQLRQSIEQSNRTIIVLDDDPTGAQTIHDIAVYTDWSVECIEQGFLEPSGMFFILTNSRAFTEEKTKQVHKEIACNINIVSQRMKKEYVIISRGDSTLRGHYPIETSILRTELERDGEHHIDGEIIIPYFLAGGRVTIDNIHYVCVNGSLIPAAETEFAKDKTFGYHHSNLCDYIEEKTKGEYLAKDVISISLEELRRGNVEAIEKKLQQATKFKKVVVNAIEAVDLEVFCIALYGAWAKGKQFLFRSAADFVKVVAGVSDQPLLSKEQMVTKHTNTGGLIIIGSHTHKTTSQLNRLKEISQIEFIEFNSDLVINHQLENEVERVVSTSQELIKEGKTVAIYTKRTLLSIDKDTKEQALLRSVEISEAVQQLVSKLTVAPAFLIAKGGITSSDIGVKALQVSRALVLGQVQPGILVWRTDNTSRFPGMPYIIFPGNVGTEDSLKIVVEELLFSSHKIVVT